MSKLDDFLEMPDVSEIRETVKETVNGKEFEFVVRPLLQNILNFRKGQTV